MYKALDGQHDRRNWRLRLLEVLDRWLREDANKNKGRLSFWVRYSRPVERGIARRPLI